MSSANNTDNSPPSSPTKQNATLKNKSSRILGPPATTNAESVSDNSNSKNNNDSEHMRKPSSSESWSLWPGKKGSAVDLKQSPQQTGSCGSSIHSREGAGSTGNDDNDNPNTNLNANDSQLNGNDTSGDDKKNDQEGLRWWQRRSSRLSISIPAVEEQVLDNDIQNGTPKAILEEHNGKAVKTSRESSWAFWRNSSNGTTNLKPLSNVVLNTNYESQEAVLYEAEDSSKKVTGSHRSSIEKPNMVVPSFEESLPMHSTKTNLYSNVNRLIRHFGFHTHEPAHLYRTEKINKTDIKKILIIGVHGFFPMKMLRSIIGEPTGTSIKFANEAEQAILAWVQSQQMNVSIQKIALEKEGKIFDRVEFFYQVMKKWCKELSNSDYIYFAAHSQGCPVTILLLSRLIEDGIINPTNKRISILAMAGINIGPYYGIDQNLVVRALSTIENDSMMELFQFQKFDSIHSKELLQSLDNILNHNVKVTFVGSIDDQLVPLYSSICCHIKHPNIFRATYIDGRSNTPSFVSTIVAIANHLNNIGLDDHGVIKEISGPLSGPLTGGGHSRIYNDEQVYQLAIQFSLYSTDLPVPTPVQVELFDISKLSSNPYHLPWCMRGLLFDTKHHIFHGEDQILTLFEQFEQWDPQSKQLKDMKYRLNGMKSKL